MLDAIITENEHMIDNRIFKFGMDLIEYHLIGPFLKASSLKMNTTWCVLLKKIPQVPKMAS